MSRKQFVLLMLVVLSAPFHARAAGDIAKLSDAFENRDRTYYLYVPDSAKTPAPLIVVLHGSGDNGLEMAQAWTELADKEGFIVLGPDSLNTKMGWDLKTDGPDYIHDVVEQVAAKHAIDPRRVYLFGQSGGAVYALTLAMLESEYFAAVAIHAGAWRHPAESKAMDYAKRKIPISISVGDQDQFFSLASVQDTDRVLTGAGFPVEVTIMANHRHWYSEVPPDFNAKVWDFLERTALDQDPKYAGYHFAPSMIP